jgi:iron complex transport system permease protein
MQSIFRNPLADPHIMGVSAGASLGAAIATMSAISHSGGLSVALAASVGAMASALIILLASKKFHSASTLLIFGIMLGFIVNALVAILQFSTDAESLKLFYSWSAGSFSTTTWSDIITLAIAVLIGTALAIAGRKGLDIILFGDEFALMAGAKVGNIRLTALLSCCIMTGAVTAFCGPLGFVGITAPHIARWMFGTSSHKVIIPASILTGGIISIAADLISQLSPSPLPTASTMALVGIPVILYILIGKPSFGK